MKFPVRFAALALFGAAALATPAKADDKIGFIYVGPAADFGYNTRWISAANTSKSTCPA